MSKDIDIRVAKKLGYYVDKGVLYDNNGTSDPGLRQVEVESEGTGGYGFHYQAAVLVYKDLWLCVPDFSTDMNEAIELLRYMDAEVFWSSDGDWAIHQVDTGEFMDGNDLPALICQAFLEWGT